MKIIALSILSISLNSFAAQTADKPLSTLSTGDVKPNVMFILDDSGSMAWSFMPDTAANYKGSTGYANAYCNGVYYNPATTYLAPKNADGTSMADASFTAAWYDGFNRSLQGPNRQTTFNLTSEFFAYDPTGGAARDTSRQQPAYYYKFNNGIPDAAQCGKEVKEEWVTVGARPAQWVWVNGRWVWDPGAAGEKVLKVTLPDGWELKTITGAEEQKNFANWFSYYRTRMLMMKSSAGAAFSQIGDRYRVGFSKINSLKGGQYGASSFLNINNYNDSQKLAWYNMLYGVNPGNGTPLKSALNAIGQIYSGVLPRGVTDPMAENYSCQQNFTILTTDGYWNAPNRNGDPDPVSVGDTDSDSNIPIPMKDPNAQQNTLADVAMYYFKRDIRPLMKNNVPGVEAFAGGEKGRQLMRTYTLGMGMDGELKRSDYPQPYTKAIPWPVAVGDTQTTIDDLWHAAINGGGEYFSAKDPNAVAVGLSKALSDIESKTASVGSADVSSSFMSQDSRSIYFSSFKTISWIGDVQSRTVNLDTSTLEAISWSASDKLALRGELGHLGRVIYTCPEESCNSLTNFDKKNSTVVAAMAAGVNALKTSNGTMSSEQITQNTAAALIDYLRGDQSNEIQSEAKSPKDLYRARKGLLGAVIHGGVSYVQKPNKAYSDQGYPAFIQSKSGRPAMTYAPANDGMLHAFNAVTGEEVWAFVPPTVIPRLWQQAERAFANDFKYFVDGAPTIADIQVGNTWKTILVAGLRGGGGEYYALDITDPLKPLALWSFSNTKLGKTYGVPVVGKVNNTWKVLLSSGYDNADNKGYLFALNANTGDLDNTFSSSCSNNEGLCALSKIGVLFENENVDDTIIMAYAGDLSGNLWRFNPKDGSSALVAKTGTTQLPQAITTAPVIKIAQQKSSTNMPLHFVTFGTGRYLKQADITNSDQHTFYGLLVDPSASVIDPAFTTLHSSMALAELTFEHNSDGDSIKRAKNSGTTETINDCKKRIKGWRTDMIIDKERLANDPRQLGERATFITSIPGGNACEAGGFSRKYSFPMEISSNLICSSDIVISVGDGKNGSLLDDPSKNPSVMTPGKTSETGETGETGGVGELDPDGSLKFSKYPWKFKGRRSGWTEIVN